MLIVTKVVSDDRRYEIVHGDEDLANLGEKPKTGIVLVRLTGVECEERIFISYRNLAEIGIMLKEAGLTWGSEAKT